MGQGIFSSQAFLLHSLKSITPFDDKSDFWLAELSNRAKQQEQGQLIQFLQTPSQAINFIGSVMTLSPFLREIMLKNPEILTPLLQIDIKSRLDEVLAHIKSIDQIDGINETLLMAQLRRGKAEAHCLIALADIGGLFTCAETCDWLSKLAEATLKSSLRFLLREAHNAKKITLPDLEHPEKDCGLIVLGMGKLGAGELNYSSDIDLIVFIDVSSSAINDPFESVDIFSKMMRRLIRIMQERTGDGYVFRVDLRLRPDPGSTPLAMPVVAALHYYEARGQNWERAAMIKARPVAGDIEAGEKVLKELSPYIWRKYLDYAAIADVHSIKRQIHAHKGHGEIAVKGHNVKLGRGGIREIEFFVQTQQLIAGGRFPELRGRRTVEMLAALCELGWINDEARNSLTKKYAFLRRVEHAIQMVADEQTHVLPEDEEGFLRVVRLLGYEDADSFSRDFLATLKAVEAHYAALFEHEQELGADMGNLVFTGEDDDPETLTTLSRLGFERPSDICRTIRTWHFGRYRATQSAEARERLTELTPSLLQAFGATKRADDALLRFDAFLQGLPAGIQLFSLLNSNPALLGMLVLIMSAAPRLADIITRKPHVFDGMLDPTTFAQLPTKSYLQERLDFFLAQATSYEEILDRLRIFADEQKFLIGIRLLTGAIDGERAGRAFTDLADLMLTKALDGVRQEFSQKHGVVVGGTIGLLGMGKLGSDELTAGSDVDIILLYDHDEKVDMSQGDKPLYVSQYYMRLTQRLIAALSAPTGEGVLYEVDMRLRPSGNKGPLAVSFMAFDKYQHNEAWVWEHMALTRARGVAGDSQFLLKLDGEIENILKTANKNDDIAAEVVKMRLLIEKEKPPINKWDIKTMAGGIIDLEFIAQFAVLSGHAPYESGKTTGDVLGSMSDKFCSPSDKDILCHAFKFYTNLSQTLRICLNNDFDPKSMPPGFAEVLQRAVNEPDFAHIENLINETSIAVRALFFKLLNANKKA
ncbi:bifunctional [glutamine synthetase] adenylyltransferase/[glutamine synthetase]-adenylyl-L-tyrosine phosphorylase [Bartonella sp. HY329]|uniref:bifunctional [glutamine synthetase] adenylyltransferase/[glutamine synthetase]-adenylyl-L-tyrosine phosphorylase n=1 Tax=unclassified Bartonella TaxID=2645622 RepID=UPI0021C6B277|nr:MULTISPECIES: bifunctional [glutamine synthetase] adenylyltransferase/[glutamine synthetase]-adenylyl-L-tyrosine phosphorylase [unclassified Bartonella]UXM93950.1 bifunctional [glutamine synthetase] adenylyltransferase/[glutamine synthetase]-adenylyl-L-tyrosine phosphorylase [Bartonella sp. HY329]UXN08271.1 bifunctional [glutamine synthetase] adenylyltransferase/[glutamine synthetase]-adenylyl-L-tyrosine phosphorylase [Bartonella sp. HY328]